MDSEKREMGLIYEELTEEIIGCFFRVYNELGYGFLEKVYENSMALTLRKQGFYVRQQAPIKVYFEGEIVGEYFADMMVEDKVILELKTAETISEAHKVQLRNYLKATQIKIGYILNFGPEATFKRMIYTKFPTSSKRKR